MWGMEDDLVRRAATGDATAFRLLVERHGALTARVARVLLRDPTAAEDAAQEAWVDAWRGLPRFRAGDPLRPWLLTLVANRCRKAVRRHTLTTVPLDINAVDAWIAISDASQAVLHRESAAELRAALASLPADHQRVLELRYFAELDLAEIAAVMGTPVGTVKSRLHRALAALRERLQSPANVAGER